MVGNRFENTQNNINHPEGLPFVTGGHCPEPRSSRFQFVSEKRKKKLHYISFLPVAVLDTMVPVLN